MADTESTARTRLQKAVRRLKSLEAELEAIGASLPVSEREDVMYAGEEEADFPAQARSVIECVLADRIGPAIRDLKEAAGYGSPPAPSKRRRTPGAPLPGNG